MKLMKFISSKTSERICEHMNKDHIESIHKYLEHYGNIFEFKKAYMEEITSKYMTIKYDGKIAKINFKKEISEDEIHETLVSMIRQI